MAYKFKLAVGTQMREEDFGLLFYTRLGPRLYFLPSGELLQSEFFQGEITLAQWLEDRRGRVDASATREQSLEKALLALRDKGVIIGF